MLDGVSDSEKASMKDVRSVLIGFLGRPGARIYLHTQTLNPEAKTGRPNFTHLALTPQPKALKQLQPGIGSSRALQVLQQILSTPRRCQHSTLWSIHHETKIPQVGFGFRALHSDAKSDEA